MKNIASLASIWDAIADTPEQAAKRGGAKQARINDLLWGRVSRFSLDALVPIATAPGWRVRMDIEAA